MSRRPFTFFDPLTLILQMSIPAYYGFAFDTPESPQYQNSPDVTLTANATCPVTVLANNYDSMTGQGDSFVGKLNHKTLSPII